MADVCFMSDEDDFIVDDDDEVENYDAEDSYDNAFGAPNKVAIAKTKKSKNILKESTNKVSTSTVKASKANSPKEKRQKAVEETYQKLTPHEHILKRPDTYIGSVEPQIHELYVLGQNNKIERKKINMTPGLFKIFDEIVVNAADNKQRDPNMDKLDITIQAETNTIIVRNNGRGIPVVMHQDQGVYVPTLIFGHLLTGSNFDDDEKKTTGGRNGYGAKLANIFSTKFIVECVDTEHGKKFSQVFTNNMMTEHKPVVKDLTQAEKKKGDFVQITFCPDLKRFQMECLDEDTVALLSKRAYDIAGSLSNSKGKKLQVILNGKVLPIKSFKDYLGCFEQIKIPTAYFQDDRWEVGVGPTTDDGAALQHISFVNAICTSSGGEHVNYIANQVITHLQKVLKKKNKDCEVSKTHIRNHLFIFVNCLIENPAFSSQTKEQLTTRSKAFGSECKLPEKFLKAVEKSGVVDEILSFAKFKQNKAMKRMGGVKKSKLTGIAKLDDANFAGTAKSSDCTLIITEGDSAKSLAMSGLSIVGRDYYGVFPLKGKPLNVREAAQAQVVKNEEIKNLVDIMGLKFGVVYNEQNVKTLRYGHLMIMADQDHDGSHIKGLVINILHYYWPGLLSIPGFLQQFITPIVKAIKGNRSLTFFTLPEYENWKRNTNNDGKGYKIKYYKGLGTSTAAEAKDYFSNLQLHEVHFGSIEEDKAVIKMENEANETLIVLDQVVPEQVVSGSDLIDMVFSKNRVEDRKQWLNKLEKGTYLDYSEARGDSVKYSDFVNKEFILFSQADNQRSIPHIMDGFKPSQRKVLFSCFKRKLKAEIKVAQLAGYISEHSAYHHGEASLTGTIIGMAQNFVGSNNVNLLTPSGQFGTRRMGGKDSASPRYVFTKLENIARKIFHPDDDLLLNYLNDDGLSIEPDFYMPVIPMVLVNGGEGIGTGWSSTIPNYNPRQIISNIRRLIAGEEQEIMIPYYDGFVGDIIPEAGKREGCFQVLGKIERVNDTTIHISELPIKKWTQDYKVFLESMMNGDPIKKIEPEIKDFKENHTDTTVSFTVTCSKEAIDKFEMEPKGLLGKFKLTGSVSTSNMHFFDKEGRITKYNTPEDILLEFFKLRIDFYERRKVLLLQKLRREQKILRNKARFIEEVCSGDLLINNRKQALILADLHDRGYDTIEKEDEKKDLSEEESMSEDDTSDAGLTKGYEYLLGMKIWSLTFEKAEELRKQLALKSSEVEALAGKAPSLLWLEDLDEIEIALDELAADKAEAAKEEGKAQRKAKKVQAGRNKKSANRKRKEEWDSDDDEDGDSEPSDLSDRENSAPKQRHVSKKPVVRTTAIKAPVANKEPSGPTDITIERPNNALKTSKSKAVHSNAEFELSVLENSAAVKETLPKKPVAPRATIKVAVTKNPSSESLDQRHQQPQHKRALEMSTSAVASSPKYPKIGDSDDDSDLGISTSLADRMKSKFTTSSPPKTLNVKSKSSFEESESEPKDEFDLDMSEFQPASVTPAKKKAVVRAAKPLIQKSGTAGKKGGPRATAKKVRAKGVVTKPTTKATTTKPPTRNAKSSSDSEDAFDQSLKHENASTQVARRATAARARAKVIYNVDLSDEDDSDFE